MEIKIPGNLECMEKVKVDYLKLLRNSVIWSLSQVPTSKEFLNPISDGFWYDVIRRGRAIMAQPDFLLYNSAKSGTNTQYLFPDKIFDI